MTQNEEKAMHARLKRAEFINNALKTHDGNSPVLRVQKSTLPVVVSKAQILAALDCDEATLMQAIAVSGHNAALGRLLANAESRVLQPEESPCILISAEQKSRFKADRIDKIAAENRLKIRQQILATSCNPAPGILLGDLLKTGAK